MSKKYDLIEWIQQWLLNHCDGDWEHDQNIQIANIDNPGWGVTINLVGTELEDKDFEKVLSETSPNNWYVCRVKDNCFLGDGGPLNLISILQVFKDWAESFKRL